MTIYGEVIKTASDHPFYVKDVGFVGAGELYIGDKLLDSKGNILLVEDMKLETTEIPTPVYNFQVEDFHTYHLGESYILVHNASRQYSSTKEFNDAISKMDPGERVGTVKREARAIADNKGFVKNKSVSRKNNLDVYTDPKTNDLYAVDTQHGTFEHCNKRGKHLGEVDFDFNPTKDADKSRNHDLIV